MMTLTCARFFWNLSAFVFVAVCAGAVPFGVMADPLDNGTGVTCANKQACYGACTGRESIASRCLWQFKQRDGTACRGNPYGSLCAPLRGKSEVVVHAKGLANVLYNGDPREPTRYLNACRFVDNISQRDLHIPQNTFEEFANFINAALATTDAAKAPKHPDVRVSACVPAARYLYILKPDNFGFSLFGEGGPRSEGLDGAWAPPQRGAWNLTTSRVTDLEGNPATSQPQIAKITYVRQDCIPDTKKCNTRNIIELRTMVVPIVPSACTDLAIDRRKNCDARWDLSSANLRVVKRAYYVERLDVDPNIIHRRNLEALDPKAVNGPFPDDLRDYQPPKE